MSNVVVQGALLQCAMGAAPSQLSVPDQVLVQAGGMNVATINSIKPNVNLMPFGMCMSPSNPQVAAATAAAMGVLTPQPCVPNVVAPWAPGSIFVSTPTGAVLTDDSVCNCLWGGVIQVSFAGQVVAQIKQGGGGGGAGGSGGGGAAAPAPAGDAADAGATTPAAADASSPAGTAAPPPPDDNKADAGPPAPVAPTYRVWSLEFSPKAAFCGDTVALWGQTNLPDGSAIELDTSCLPVWSSLPNWHANASGGSFSMSQAINGVNMMGPPGTTPAHASMDFSVTALGLPSDKATLKVKGKKDAPEDTYTRDDVWNGFSNHTEFQQKIEGYVVLITVRMKILKGWGLTYVQASDLGLTGDSAGAPAGRRWARSTSGAMAPDQYWDGTQWKPIPGPISDYNCYGFYKSGSSFVSPSGPSLAAPEPFADYNFNDPVYVAARRTWAQNTRDRWSDKFQIRRQACTSPKGTRCCLYDVQVAVLFDEVTSADAHTVVVAPGPQRSNAGLFFMGDSRAALCPHEVGHHMGNPDEYRKGGFNSSAVDPTDPGLVNGIDANSLMGQNMTQAKKRHFATFATMTQRLLSRAYGTNEPYIVVDK